MAEALKHLVAARRELALPDRPQLRPWPPRCGASTASRPRRSASPRTRTRRPRRSPTGWKNSPRRRTSSTPPSPPGWEARTRASQGRRPKGEGRAQGRREERPSPRTAEGSAEAKDAEPKEARPRTAQGRRRRKGQGGPEGQGPARARPRARAGPGEEGSGEPKKLDRRAIAEKQEGIADEVRDLEEKLKRLEMASDLAKARMAKAAEKVEQAAGDLDRGNTKEATDDAKAGAGMLHELARQVKGEIAREAADELAMARDLAEELARREAELGRPQRQAHPPPATRRGDQKGEKGQGREKRTASRQGRGQGRQGRRPGGKGEGQGGQAARVPRPGKVGSGGWARSDRGRADRADGRDGPDPGGLAQADRPASRGRRPPRRSARSSTRGTSPRSSSGRPDGRAPASAARRPRSARRPASWPPAWKPSRQALELLHRGIVAPELAAMVEFDRRVAELTARLARPEDRRRGRRLAARRRRPDPRPGEGRDRGAAELAGALRAGGGWHWDDGHSTWSPPTRSSAAPSRHRPDQGPGPGPDPQGPGLRPRRGHAAEVPGAGRALLRGDLRRAAGRSEDPRGGDPGPGLPDPRPPRPPARDQPRTSDDPRPT